MGTLTEKSFNSLVSAQHACEFTPELVAGVLFETAMAGTQGKLCAAGVAHSTKK